MESQLEGLDTSVVLSDVHTFQNYEQLPGTSHAITRFEFSYQEQQANLHSKKQTTAGKHELETTNTTKAVTRAKKRKHSYEQVKELPEHDKAVAQAASTTDDTEDKVDDSRHGATVDNDGDFDGRRKPDEDETGDGYKVCDDDIRVNRVRNIAYINIKHNLATELNSVGEQVWLGALLLCDYILDNGQQFAGQVVVDLGSGTGLTSIVTALYASRVICTDVGENVLQLASDNVEAARLYHGLPGVLCPVDVRELDWFSGLQASNHRTSSYSLTAEDVEKINAAQIIIAADVVYDNDITDVFFKTVWGLLKHPPDKTLYLGLEKRLVFTMEELQYTLRVSVFFHYVAAFLFCLPRKITAISVFFPRQISEKNRREIREETPRVPRGIVAREVARETVVKDR